MMSGTATRGGPAIVRIQDHLVSVAVTKMMGSERLLLRMLLPSLQHGVHA